MKLNEFSALNISITIGGLLGVFLLWWAFNPLTWWCLIQIPIGFVLIQQCIKSWLCAYL